MYRPPKQQAADDTALYEEIHPITQNKQSVIIGDFNCPKINWSAMNGDQEGNKVLKILEDTFKIQSFTQPTQQQQKYPWCYSRDWPWPRPQKDDRWDTEPMWSPTNSLQH